MLLSPACASFDQYRNFEVRGDAFRELVRALPGVIPMSSTLMRRLVMKAFLAPSLCSTASRHPPPVAASVTVPDNSTSLAGVAAATTALLLDAGLKPQNAGGGVFVLDAKNFHCDQHLNGALDASSVRAGLPTLKCRINSQNKRGTNAGQPFGEGRAMTELLQKVQGSNPPGGAAFSDCGMGYCGIFAKSIKCTIDTKIGNFSNGGRWSCVFTDGQ